MQAAGTPPAVIEQELLVDLLLLRGQLLGRIADYERATGLADVLVRDAPNDGAAWLARARARATFHRFAEALSDLDAARQRGVDRAAVDEERAAILQAVGCSAEAFVLRRDAARRRPDLATLGALAVLQAERGEVTEAENLFAEARRRYRGVSPFPLAELDFRRGLMWFGERDLPAARAWFATAVHRVPAYAPALAHLAEVDAALGAPDAAVKRLHALTMSSDDPEYANTLACALSDAGRPREAERWHVCAASRYQELVSRHPEAFAHHVIVDRADQCTRRPLPGSAGTAVPRSDRPPGTDHAPGRGAAGLEPADRTAGFGDSTASPPP